MTTNFRRSLAATGAATLLTALGVFATMQPASAMPADPGSPGTLSGNIVHVPTGRVAAGDGAVGMSPITEDQFNDHADSEYGHDICDQVAIPGGQLQYCGEFEDGYNAGTQWNAWVSVPQGTRFKSDVTIDYVDGMTGSDMQVTGSANAHSEYTNLYAGASQYTQPEIQSDVIITLNNGSSYRAHTQMTLNNGEYSGRTFLSPN